MSIQQLTTNSVIDKAINARPSKLLTIKEFIDAVEYDIDRLYIDKFWLFLYEQSNNEFGIYLDTPLIKMIGFAAKDDKLKKRNCVNLLKTFAKDGIDYITSNKRSHTGAQLRVGGKYQSIEYYITSDCFRRLISKANTKYSDKVRDEYMKFEKLCAIYNTYKSIFKEKQSLVQYEEKEEEADDRITFEYMFDNQSVQIFKCNDKFMFIGKQIARLLGYKNTVDAIATHVKPRNKVYFEQIQKERDSRSLPKMHPQTILIDEAGLYSLILSSKLPAAKKFKRYVDTELMPLIKKNKQLITKHEESNNKLEFMFENSAVRIFGTINKPFFMGKDVANILGYKETHKAISKLIPARNKISYKDYIATNGRDESSRLPSTDIKSILIDEAGLYSLIMKSKMQIAEKFQIWVTNEVLPSIRRTGEYKLQRQLEIKDNEYQQQLRLKDDEHQKQLANYEREMARLKRLANLPRIDEKISTDSLLYIATNDEMMKQNIFKVGHVKRATHKAMKERLQTYRTGYADPLRLVKLYIVRNAAVIDSFFKDISQHYKQPADKAKELVTMPYEWLCAYLDKLTINNQSIIEDINARTMNEYEQAMAKQPDIQFLSDEEWQRQASIEPQEEEKRDTPDYIKPDNTIDYNKFIDKILRDNGIKEGDIVRWQKLRMLSTAEKNKQKITINYDQVKNTIKIQADAYKITFKCTK